MAKLIYSAITSLDGCIADQDGNFDWAMPDEDAHAFVNDLERPVGTYLYGRRMYELMVYWETAHTGADHPVEQDFAEIWQAAEKVVYSTRLETVSSARTRIERAFVPAVTIGGQDHFMDRLTGPRSPPPMNVLATTSRTKTMMSPNIFTQYGMPG